METENGILCPSTSSPFHCLSLSLPISLRLVMEAIWKPHSQTMGKWFTRTVSSPRAFFNITWCQRPHSEKHWKRIWQIYWQQPARHHKITQRDLSDTKLLGSGRSLSGGSFYPTWTKAWMANDFHRHLAIVDRFRIIHSECWDHRLCTKAGRDMMLPGHKQRSLFSHAQRAGHHYHCADLM